MVAGVWVVLLVVVGVGGAGHLRVRGCGRVWAGVGGCGGWGVGRLGRLVACWWTTFVGVVRDVRV